MTILSLVEISDLPRLLQHAVILDVRSHDAYWQGHLKGALRVEPSLAALPKTDRASVQQYDSRLQWLLSTLGVQTGSTVLIYGETLDGGVARVAWALDYAGLARVTVFNGPFEALRGVELETIGPQTTAVNLTLNPRRHLLATASGLSANLADATTRVLDARELDDYRGTRANPARRGHIPGALHWDNRQEVSADGRIDTPTVLAARFGALGLEPGQPIATYCGSGPRASRTWLALRHAGYTNVSVYQASWGEWGASAELPVEVDGERAPAVE
ncbi:rhodanese-like domain protein [Paraburkholderia xenovorans LB400]|uniref:Rhodanese-like sulfur transferase n=1 Tax=Paraburkholderia xenovorans (strain LB400) TaxID=266265 RepID=Q13GI3_PARXL|nr:rhodanese-like domain-containing protein [Paraburkholderia xenovorans]ABE36806.1 Putative rhodanese-like sulfur transferase [Paraburkholderia xenovorans LB400]AIP34871.1 rhodanese-like domain protein [Paraburkholderia xenovorans LB400]